jgi:hydroxymethylpyrimidine/phosphomethylpyrimidine kinase
MVGMKGRVLIVAGSDSGGGAGIQADIKTVTALGGYAATALTAVTAQDTRRVHDILPISPELVARQMALTLDDIGADAVKTGMLGNAAIIDAVADVLEAKAASIPLVVDPVLAAKDGRLLLGTNGLAALKRRLCVIATLITPNLAEAEALTGRRVHNREDMTEVAFMLQALGCRAALLKGGHLDGPTVVDLLVADDEMECFEYPRVETRHTHGTGCTLASAIAVGLAQGQPMKQAVARARAYVQEAIYSAPGFGHGHGPLNHAHTVRAFEAS